MLVRWRMKTTSEHIAPDYARAVGQYPLTSACRDSGLMHEGMLMDWLPKKQIAIEADLFDSTPGSSTPKANRSFVRVMKGR